MQIKFTSVLVHDQEEARRFYTEVLGFEVASDVPMGTFRWLTVRSPDGVAGAEVVLEPMGFPPARDYQRALFEAGIPITAFITDDIAAEVARLQAKGVTFRTGPTRMGTITTALFPDGCGNLLNLVQVHA